MKIEELRIGIKIKCLGLYNLGGSKIYNINMNIGDIFIVTDGGPTLFTAKKLGSKTTCGIDSTTSQNWIQYNNTMRELLE